MTDFHSIVPAPQPVLLDGFREVIRSRGAAAARTRPTRLSADASGIDEIFYVPFEHMNRGARFVIVGITPGPNQIELAYQMVQAGLEAGLGDDDILARAKEAGSFGGPKMRPNLLTMLQAFGFAGLLGIDDPADLWGRASGLLHATSVVPHAAFRKGKPFAGSFADVLGSPVMRACFERDFAATLPLLSPEALYVALGPTPLAALDWCAERGLLRSEQVMGALAHPSSAGGSQVPIYLGEKTADDLDARDPVRGRAEWLVDAAARLRRSVSALGGAASPEPTAPARTMAKTAVGSPSATHKENPMPTTPIAAAATKPLGLHFVVSRGAHAGTILRPHVQDSSYIVSLKKYEADYIRVPLDQPLEPWLARGYRLRMSAPGHPSSLIAPASIRGRRS